MNNSGFREWSQHRPQERPIFYGKKKTIDEEFPPLKTASPVKLRTEQQQQGPSLAARLATAIKNDEQNNISRRVIEQPKPIQQYDLLPISQYGRLKYLSERKAQAERQASLAEEEHEYRWQISHEISREKFDKEYGLGPSSLPDDSEEVHNYIDDTHADEHDRHPVE
jgi:hypothetical protein